MLKLTAKIFYPLGFLSPFVIRLKILFQVLCSEKLDWDQPHRGEMNKTWNLIFEELKPLGYARIPRCYFYPGFQKIDVQLHGISDASERAYAAVVYIRVAYSDGRIETRLVASKTGVSPIKKQTIPRLELLGTVILSRLTTTVLKALLKQVNQINYWVNSRTVLCWIQNEKCYVCLFTCTSTRAVHLELTPNVTVESFLLAFCALQVVGDCLQLYSPIMEKHSSKEIVKIA